MYIEFDLPALGYYGARGIIEQAIAQWHERYGIQYRKKPVKQKLRITFDQDDSYTFWAMTWNPQQHELLSQYRIVSDLNNKI